jgi:protein-L-isoaspartate(D-aspartate) O-methyltransferase
MYLKSKLNHNNSSNFIKENSDLKEKIRILEAKASLNQSSSALKVKAPLYQNSPSKMKNSVSCDLNITNQEIEPFQDLFPTDSLKIFYSSCKKQNKPKKIEQVMLVASLSSTIPNLSSKIIEILESTDRGHFIPHGFKPYDDKPQRIGFGATISAPHMHAYTLNWLEKYLKPDIKVLDIGSGSGYLTLCLAKMIGRGKVFGVDHIEELVDQSYTNINNSDPELLDALGNLISIFCKDGRDGLPEYAPFNVIHFGASVNEVSQSIINQLAPGGVIIAPVGPAGKTQVISMIVKDDKGKLSTKTYLNVCYGSLMDKNQQLQ